MLKPHFVIHGKPCETKSMVDVITICGRWYGHLMNAGFMADVFAISGRWNSHLL